MTQDQRVSIIGLGYVGLPLATAFAEGHSAGSSGKGVDTNPYPEGSPEALKWGSGWSNAQAAIASRMGPKKGRGGEARA